MKLRIGLIGQGADWTARYHPSLRLMQDRFDVRAVYSSVSVLAEQVAHDYGAQRVDGYRSLISREDIDAVFMLESDWYGILPLIAACQYGKAVYCGSEISFALDQSVELKRQVNEAGIAFMTEFPRRFAPATLRLKELIATRLGRPRLMFCHRRLACEGGPAVRASQSLETRAGRELMELIDWCEYIVGQPASWIQAVRHPSRTNPSVADYQVLSMGIGGETNADHTTLAQISCGAYIPAMWQEAIAFRPPAAVQVCCEKGLAFVDLPNTLVWFDEAGRHQESLEAELPVGVQLFTQFHRAVTSLVRKVSGLEDAFQALTILRHAKQSMESGVRTIIGGDPIPEER